MFNNYAEIYDALYDDRYYTQEADLIDNISKTHFSSKVNILDLGCGTGKHSIELSKRGHSVTGVDISPDMLAIAQLNLEKESKVKCNFLLGDIRLIKIGKKFDIVILMFHVINLLLKTQEVESLINEVYSSLNKDGILIFDCWNGDLIDDKSFSRRMKKFEHKGQEYSRITNYTHLSLDRKVKVEFQFINDSNPVDDLSRYNENHEVRYFLRSEIAIFMESKFEIVTNISSSTFESSTEADQSVIYICKKLA